MHGPIPALPSSLVTLDLGKNRFTGHLGDLDLGAMTELQILDLSNVSCVVSETI
jgi:hypothetical protein